MSHWNHRVVKHVEKNGDVWYGIHEVHYNDDGEVWAISDPPEVTTNERHWRKSFLKQLNWMIDCLKAPVLTEGDLADAPKRLEDALKGIDKSPSYASVEELLESLNQGGVAE